MGARKVAAVGIVGVSADRVLFFVPAPELSPSRDLFGSLQEKVFMGFALLLGVCMGPMQAASPASDGFWLRMLFVACWLVAALLVAGRGEPGTASVVTVVFLISFPIAFSGASAGAELVDQIWRAVGSVSVVAFLYLFPRGQFEPRWTGLSCALSALYLAVRAPFAEVAAWPGDLVVFPLIVLLPLALQVARFRSASNALDRRRVQVVGLTSGTALLGQLILFGLQSGGWLGPTRWRS